MFELSNTLSQEFIDKEYAHGYMQSHLLDQLALQVHVLRNQRNLSQKQLAELSGVPQSKISKIETGDFESLSVKTLFKLAEAFDIATHLEFYSFVDGIQDVVNVSVEKLKVPCRTDDLHAHRAVRQFATNPAVSHIVRTASATTHLSASSRSTYHTVPNRVSA